MDAIFSQERIRNVDVSKVYHMEAFDVLEKNKRQMLQNVSYIVYAHTLVGQCFFSFFFFCTEQGQSKREVQSGAEHALQR